MPCALCVCEEGEWVVCGRALGGGVDAPASRPAGGRGRAKPARKKNRMSRAARAPVCLSVWFDAPKLSDTLCAD